MSGIKRHMDVHISFISQEGEECFIDPSSQEENPHPFKEGFNKNPFDNSLKFNREKKKFSVFPKKMSSFFNFSKPKSRFYLPAGGDGQKKPQQKTFKGFFVLCSCTWFPILIGSTYLGVLKVSAPLTDERSQKIRSFIDTHLFHSLQSFKNQEHP